MSTELNGIVNERRLALIQQITQVFDGVTREGGVSLHEADVIDNYGSMQERLKARKLDRETRWQDVPDADIEHHYWILSFLDPIGFRYYIPAYMVWTLRNYRTSDSASIDSTIYALHLTDQFRESRMERYATFTHVQSAAVCAFLRFMLEDTDDLVDTTTAQAALEGYWCYYC